MAGELYGCGFINVTDYTVVEALLPESSMVTWEGEGSGHSNGSKCKFDYLHRLVFIVADTTTGLPQYLFRATLVPGTPATISLSYAELPEVNEGGEFPIPNQLTTDQTGAIYFPGGPVLSDNGCPVFIKAVVTDDTPPNLTITYSIVDVGEEDEYTGTFCTTLSVDHSMIATYARSPGLNGGDAIYIFTTADPIGYFYDFYVQAADQAPYNMETDVNTDSLNFGWSYVIVPGRGGNTLLGFQALPPFGTQYNSCYSESDQELVLAVGKKDSGDVDGNVYTMERFNYVPGPQPIYVYAAQGAGVVTYTVTIPNGAATSPTHHDIRRSSGQDDIWPSSAISPETDGEVRENSVTVGDNLRHQRAGYIQISTACRRETYAPPVPPPS